MAPPVTLPGAYDHISTFQNIANPTEKWRATMTFAAPAVPGPSTPIVQAIEGFMSTVVHSDAQIIQHSVYNWARGRQPYPLGTPIFTITGAVPGVAGAEWTALASPYIPAGGEVVLRIDHEPVGGGRPGRNFFRALLGKSDVSSTSGGKWILVPTVLALQVNLATILTATSLATFLNGGVGGARLIIVRYSPKTNIVHGETDVSTLQVVGVTTNKLSRKNRR